MTRSTKATKSHSLSRRLVLEQCASDRVGATYVPGKFLAGVANAKQSDGTYSKTGRGGKYDDLEQGRDGKFYGKKKDKGDQGRGKGLPPGLAKKGKLPPGLQKQLERKGHLPPGLAANPLPYEAVVNLPPPANGTERAIVDTSVVLLEKGTGLILDVLKDVLTRP